MEIVILIVVILVILAFIAIWLYNNLVQLRNRVDNAWSQIDVQLQRRLDLIPNLVETVKGYAAHESNTLTAVTQARTAVMSAPTPEAKMQADNMLTNTLRSLFAVSEAYPNLKADANFRQLQSEITGTEDKISYMRQSYNDCVMAYNNAIQTFPGVILAGPFGFTKRDMFDANVAASAAPVVNFGQTPAMGVPDVNTASAPVAVPNAPSIQSPQASQQSPSQQSGTPQPPYPPQPPQQSSQQPPQYPQQPPQPPQQ